MMKKLFLSLLLLTAGCEMPTQFSNEALQDKFTSIDGQEYTLNTILTKHKGEKILIDIWASWCRDCIVTLSELKKLQQENPEVHYVFLSLDKSKKNWLKAVDRLKIKGDHYYMKTGKKGTFGRFLGLWWIPRYIVVNELGEIIVFKATKITDKNILKALKIK
ncbi:MAG: TlpA family protein disulfide reductase [Flavobacteriaceae bacterium]